jgi:hypothetical protein
MVWAERRYCITCKYSNPRPFLPLAAAGVSTVADVARASSPTQQIGDAGVHTAATPAPVVFPAVPHASLSLLDF